MIPSIKGYAVLPVAQRIRTLLEAGVIKDLEAQSRLSEDALQLLETEPGATLWYPITIQDELLRLLRDLEGGGNDRYLREQGLESAAEILQARSISLILTGARSFRRHTGRALVGMAQLVLNFGSWSFEGPGLHDFTVRAADAAPLPDSVRAHTEGFISELATRVVGKPVKCVSSRPAPDLILFRGRLEGVREP